MWYRKNHKPTTKENEMDEMTATVTPYYDQNATIVINEAGGWYNEVKPKAMTAQELSGILRQYNAMTQREATKITNLDKCKEYLLENLDELDDHATEIAKILDIDLSTTATVTLNVTINLDLTIPAGFDVDDLDEYDFDISVSYGGGDGVEIEGEDIVIDSIDNSGY